MAFLELGPLTDYLEQEDISRLHSALGELEVDPLELDQTGESAILERNIDEGALAEILDLLDANQAASDVYLPQEFEESLHIGEIRIGSAPALLRALDELGEDLDVSEDLDEDLSDLEDSPEDFDNSFSDEEGPFSAENEFDPAEFKDRQLQNVWRVLYKGAQACIEAKTGLFVHI